MERCRLLRRCVNSSSCRATIGAFLILYRNWTRSSAAPESEEFAAARRSQLLFGVVDATLFDVKIDQKPAITDS